VIRGVTWLAEGSREKGRVVMKVAGAIMLMETFVACRLHVDCDLWQREGCPWQPGENLG
jgi:hypothetical protein